MKSIRHCRIEREIVFSNKKVINVAVENPTLLRLLLEELENPDDTSSYAFHFYSDDKELLFEKNCVFIKDCFCPEMDEKKIAAFIQKDIASRISEEDQVHLQRITNEFAALISDISSEYPIPVEIDSETPFQTLLKAFSITPIGRGDSYLETLILRIQVLAFVLKRECFIFYNLLDYLTEEEWDSFCKEMRRLELVFFVLSSHSPCRIFPNEALIKIDEDNFQLQIDSEGENH